MGAVAFISRRLVGTMVIFSVNSLQRGHRGTEGRTKNLFLLLSAAPRSICRDGRGRPSLHFLDVNRLPARLANRRQRIARAIFLFDPLLFVADDIKQQLLIFRAWQILFTVLLVTAIVQRLASLAVILLPRPLSDAALKADVGGVELFLASRRERVQALDQARNFFSIQLTAVVVEVVAVGGPIVHQF